MNSIIWRESIYKNKFKCNRCGAKLFDPVKQQPTNNLGVNGEDETDNRCFCIKCKNYVAVVKEVPDGTYDLMGGKYSDFEMNIKAEAEKVQEEKRQNANIREQNIFLNKQIVDLNSQIKNLKETNEKLRAKHTKELEKLNKQIMEMEHQMKRMEDALNGNN